MTRDIGNSVGDAADAVDLISRSLGTVNEGELDRLRSLCAQLINTISVRQNYFAKDIELFCNSPTQTKWDRLRAVMMDLATEVSRMFTLLKREEGDFVIESQDTYRSLVMGLNDRKRLYDEIDGMIFPPSEDDLVYLRKMASDYTRLREGLVKNQQDIAQYILMKKGKSAPPVSTDDASINTGQNGNYALVMKGGGLKGLACIGALRELQRFYNFDLYVGTSAGAIIASLLGAGYTPEEMETILREMNFADFLNERFKAITNLFFHGGLFQGTELSNWIDKLLAEKLKSANRVTFQKLVHHVIIYACRRDTDALIFDSKESPRMAVAHAVRCSIAIPFFFTPEREQGLHVFDGGMRHNYPVKKLLEQSPNKKFVGLYLGDPIYTPSKPSILRDLMNISNEATDVEALERYRSRTVIIDPKPISTLDFALSDEEKTFLLSQGRAAALEFLHANGHIEQDEVTRAIELAKQHKVAALKARGKRTFRRKLLGGLSLAGVLSALFVWIYVHNADYTGRTENGKPDPAVDTILGDCHGRAVYTLMHAQQNEAAMFASLAKCRKSIQKHSHEIKRGDLQRIATQLIMVIDKLEQVGSSDTANKNGAINLLKLTMVRSLRQLAAATGRNYLIPEDGKLLDSNYLTEQQADAAVSLDVLGSQRTIDPSTGDRVP